MYTVRKNINYYYNIRICINTVRQLGFYRFVNEKNIECCLMLICSAKRLQQVENIGGVIKNIPENVLRCWIV